MTSRRVFTPLFRRPRSEIGNRVPPGRALLLLVLPWILAGSPPPGPVRWAVGDQGIEILAPFASQVGDAIKKVAAKAPAWKPGAEVRVVVRTSEGGARPERTGGTELLEGQPAEIDGWLAKWLLPVVTPGLAVPVRLTWEKPGKGEKKEKVPPGGTPTQPPPGFRYQVGYAPAAAGALALDEVLRGVRLVFQSGDACEEELLDMPKGSARSGFWHLDVAADGAVNAIPQDLWVPPPPEGKGKKGGGGGDAKAPEAKAEAPKAEAPKAEAPKAEFGGFKAPEAKKPEMKAPEAKAPEAKKPEVELPEGKGGGGGAAGGAAGPARDWTPLETCIGKRLATARFKMPGKGGAATQVDEVAVTAWRP
jgi:hypothetical protein